MAAVQTEKAAAEGKHGQSVGAWSVEGSRGGMRS